MEPLNDDELSEFLRQWEAPAAPVSLRPPPGPRTTNWRWLLTGSIRVPIPAGIAAVLIVLISMYLALAARQVPVRTPQTVTLADFQPVKQLQPRIIRSAYENK